MTAFTLLAPFAAWAGPLSEVPDPAFADRLLGDGLALDPLDGEVRAPCAAEVMAVAPTAHSVTLRHASGAELLIHVGIDTVVLGGRGFEVLVAPGQQVAEGEPLLRFDLDAVAGAARSLMTPLLLLSDGFRIEATACDRQVAAGEPIATVATSRSMAQVVDEIATHGAAATRSFEVPLANGLHARPSARVAAALKPFAADVALVVGDRHANARSLTALLKLNVRHGDRVTLTGHGADADAAVTAVADLILSGLDEHPSQHVPVAEAIRPIDTSPALISGVRAAPGGAVGVAFRLATQDLPVPERRGTTTEERLARDAAVAEVTGTLRRLSRHSDVADAHLSLLGDPEFQAAVDARIAAGLSAPAAWRAATRDEIAALDATGNPLLAERAADLLDVERQIVTVLVDAEATSIALPERAIVIADEVLPSTFLSLDLTRVAAIATSGGGPTSHVALLAAANGVPMLVSCGPALQAIAEGTSLLVDADAPLIRVAPAAEALAAFAAAAEHRRAVAGDQARAATADCYTADGRRIEVFANCGSAADARAAAEHGAEGCGLLRTEFLFLERQAAPTVDEQADAYARIADALAGRPVIVRTLDAGSDKPLPYLPSAIEENPALGIRGIRLCLARPELLDDQFTAILRAIAAPQRRIMLPMVVELAELRAARALLRTVEARLGIAEPTPLGIMVETPAAALLAGQLAQEADFLSIGSNDLTQYALAADRQNPALAAVADALHPAVLRLIRLAAEGAHAHGRWLGVCGGIASDPDAAALLIGLGVDELSAVPQAVPAIKARVRSLLVDDCRRLAAEALTKASAGEVRSLIEEDRTPHAL